MVGAGRVGQIDWTLECTVAERTSDGAAEQLAAERPTCVYKTNRTWRESRSRMLVLRPNTEGG